MHAASALHPAAFVVSVAVAAGISLAVFAHASRYENAHATAWGVGAFLAAGVVVPLYFLRFWLDSRARP